MKNRPASQHGLGPGEAARKLGVTVKALRVYEHAGLILPERREGGWRHYGPESFERLHCVLALKSLGLSLAEIRTLLDFPGTNLAAVLDLQAQALSAQLIAARQRLEAIRRAQQVLAQAGCLSTEALLALSRPHPPVEMTPEQVFAAIGRIASEASAIDIQPFAAIAETEVANLVAQASRLAASGCGAADPEAAALAARWDDLAARCASLPATPAPGVRALADDLLTSRSLAPALAFLRSAVARRRQATVEKEP